MRKFYALAAFLLLASPAVAQQVPPAPPTAFLAPTPASLSVTTSSARVAFASDIAIYPVVTVVNVGANEAFLNIGGSTVAATTSPSGYVVSVQPGAYVSFFASVKDGSGAQVNTYLAAITATSTATLRVFQSNGAPAVGTFNAGTYNITTANLVGANVGLLNTSAAPIDPATSQGQASAASAAAVAPSNTVTVTVGRWFAVVATVAGSVKVGFASGNFTFPVAVGLTLFPWAVNQVFVTGTTATATYANLN